jgi:hypothetical protein
MTSMPSTTKSKGTRSCACVIIGQYHEVEAISPHISYSLSLLGVAYFFPFTIIALLSISIHHLHQHIFHGPKLHIFHGPKLHALGRQNSRNNASLSESGGGGGGSCSCSRGRSQVECVWILRNHCVFEAMVDVSRYPRKH